VFENSVLRGIFRLRRDKMVGCWRKLHNKELHNLYSPSNIMGMNKWRTMKSVWHEGCMGKKRNAYRILIGKTEEKTP
jgi:hypothetical protein